MMWRKKLLEAKAPTTSWAGRWRQTCAPGGWRQEAGVGGQQRCPATRSSAAEELAWRCPVLSPPPSSWGPWPHSSWRGSGCFAARAVASSPATPSQGTRWRGGRWAGAGWQGGRGPGSPGKHLVDLFLLLLPGKLPVPPAASLPAASCQPSAALPSTISLSHLCTRHLLAQRPLSANLRSSNFSSLTQSSASHSSQHRSRCLRYKRRSLTVLTIPSLGTIRHLFQSLHPLTCPPALLLRRRRHRRRRRPLFTSLFFSIQGSSHGFREARIRATE